MILTITLNPAYDLIYWVKEIEQKGETQLSRAFRTHSSAGGKGINVSIYLASVGVENVAMGLIGGHTGRTIKRSLREEGIVTNFTWISEETRSNVAILKKGQEDNPIEVNSAGPEISERVQEQFMEQYETMLHRVSCVVLSGSLPPGVPKSYYQELAEKAKEMGIRTVVNTGGENVKPAAKAGPFLIKPDIRERKEVMGEKLTNSQSIVEVGRKMLDFGTEYVLLSHGLTGDILISKDKIWELEANREELTVRNRVGAGDSLIGGIIYQLEEGKTVPEAVRYGLAAGMASVEVYEKICRDASLVQAQLEQVTLNELGDSPK
ncbi:1-phosphofructokinase family hexose kinase [Candidatus Bipolaricaulota bacterium]|nr:1-phosphofructokinase family hexose kinase [Candidatus Bipolaricaulota bacterium]